MPLLLSRQPAVQGFLFLVTLALLLLAPAAEAALSSSRGNHQRITRTSSRQASSILHGSSSNSNNIHDDGVPVESKSNRRPDEQGVHSQQRRPQRMFAQPAFASRQEDVRNDMNHPNNRSSSRHRPIPKSDSRLTDLHNQRLKTAGRVGTKRFVNPCKVYIGNLPYSMDEPQQLQEYISDQMGLPALVLLNDVRIIKDWKTNRSKGYAFVVFTEAIHATVCIDALNGKELEGRILTVSQGLEKRSHAQIYVDERKSTKTSLDADEAAILAGLGQASPFETPNQQKQQQRKVPKMDPEEVAVLRRLDPDLVNDDDMDDEYYNHYSLKGKQLDDADLFGDYDDDDDDGVDGVWEDLHPPQDDDGDEIVVFDETTQNRKQRRQAARKQPRRKLPHKGFGGGPNA